MKKVKLSDFYNFANGAKVEESESIRWLNEVKETLIKSNSDSDFSFMGSGNTIVIGLKFESGEYEFIVADRYKSLDNHDIESEKLENVVFV